MSMGGDYKAYTEEMQTRIETVNNAINANEEFESIYQKLEVFVHGLNKWSEYVDLYFGEENPNIRTSGFISFIVFQLKDDISILENAISTIKNIQYFLDQSAMAIHLKSNKTRSLQKINNKIVELQQKMNKFKLHWESELHLKDQATSNDPSSNADYIKDAEHEDGVDRGSIYDVALEGGGEDDRVESSNHFHEQGTPDHDVSTERVARDDSDEDARMHRGNEYAVKTHDPDLHDPGLQRKQTAWETPGSLVEKLREKKRSEELLKKIESERLAATQEVEILLKKNDAKDLSDSERENIAERIEMLLKHIANEGEEIQHIEENLNDGQHSGSGNLHQSGDRDMEVIMEDRHEIDTDSEQFEELLEEDVDQDVFFRNAFKMMGGTGTRFQGQTFKRLESEWEQIKKDALEESHTDIFELDRERFKELYRKIPKFTKRNPWNKAALYNEMQRLCFNLSTGSVGNDWCVSFGKFLQHGEKSIRFNVFYNRLRQGVVNRHIDQLTLVNNVLKVVCGVLGHIYSTRYRWPMEMEELNESNAAERDKIYRAGNNYLTFIYRMTFDDFKTMARLLQCSVAVHENNLKMAIKSVVWDKQIYLHYLNSVRLKNDTIPNGSFYMQSLYGITMLRGLQPAVDIYRLYDAVKYSSSATRALECLKVFLHVYRNHSTPIHELDMNFTDTLAEEYTLRDDQMQPGYGTIRQKNRNVFYQNHPRHLLVSAQRP